MNILLVNPPFFMKDAAGGNPSIMKVLNIIPPLGLGYLASVLRNSGYSVRIVDGGLYNSFESFEADLVKEQCAVAGITATTPVFENAKKTARALRNAFPEIKIVIGGSHVTALPKETLSCEYFDIGIVGEGEETLLELVAELTRNSQTNLDKIKGIAFKENGKVAVNERREFIKELDLIPYPARDLFPALSCYSPTPASYRKLPLGVVIASRGCPMKCTFCDRAIFGDTYRVRSVSNVLDEVDELIKKYGAKEIRFFDDMFTVNKSYVVELCRKMRERKIRIPWTCLSSAGTASKDMFVEMRRAGCWQILFGLESGDNRMLKLLGKRNTVLINERAVRFAKEAGLEVRGDFIVGTPGETMDSLKRTFEFTVKIKLDYAHFNKFVPYPGTDLYNTLVQKGYSFDFSKPSSIVDHETIHFVPEGMTRKEYKKFLDSAEKRFYLRPSHIIRRLFAIRTFTQFKGQVRGALAMCQS